MVWDLNKHRQRSKDLPINLRYYQKQYNKTSPTQGTIEENPIKNNSKLRNSSIHQIEGMNNLKTNKASMNAKNNKIIKMLYFIQVYPPKVN